MLISDTWGTLSGFVRLNNSYSETERLFVPVIPILYITNYKYYLTKILFNLVHRIEFLIFFYSLFGFIWRNFVPIFQLNSYSIFERYLDSFSDIPILPVQFFKQLIAKSYSTSFNTQIPPNFSSIIIDQIIKNSIHLI